MFAAEVPQKLIKEVTGHKLSQALQIYERSTVAQKQAVSRVLTAGGSSLQSYAGELDHVKSTSPSMQLSGPSVPSSTQERSSLIQPVTPHFISAMFNGLSNCTINFSPNNFTLNLNPQLVNAAAIEEEFDAVVDSLPDDQYTFYYIYCFICFTL